ncbi:pilus assembly protein TadG-related protein [Tropicimonas sp. TH_r6]|uniref:pilus assembly protein TadG-related protein n=1 Tax=Tropicimonas sp. TH_r6 TaxID=3082085 RepID=UPI002953C384|nr:pilus assembly protein TadG-related protein [Tropicimonas sp. TH_r6]MDV7142643.1 pilus assembly protein TadG-related protein [Tropicimonas sp. TH_r6]
MSAPMRRFAREEDGGMIIFTLFILVCMLLAVGMAIDTVRTEFARIKIQNTIDSAILAAADLDQTLDPQSVVEDYLARAGIDPGVVDIDVTSALDASKISVTSTVNVKTMFMDMIGIETLAAPATGTAEESVTELEIVLVLDNSGSMANNNNFRLNLLKEAASNFVDQILENENADGEVAISIVPFATQVNAGPDLLSHYTVSNEHNYSNCITFEADDFLTTAMSTTQLYNRTAHFDPSQSRLPPRDKYRVCRTDTSRQITPWSDNADYLKQQINDMVGFGWTSIELGTKWGAALLDPSAQPVLSAMIDDGLVDEKFRGQPFDYGDSEEGISRKKYLIVMSDGANTNQWEIKDPYRSGLSPIFIDGGLQNVDVNSDADSSIINKMSFYDEDRDSPNQYYSFITDTWILKPEGEDSAVQLTWPEVWDMMSVEFYTDTIYAVALGENGSTEFNNIVESWSSTTKKNRTWDICGKAAETDGVLVFTIGMDTYGEGDETLLNCSTDPENRKYFYDVETSTDVDALNQAFTSIARTINQLRLTN